jgi:hypothetical protein
MTVKTLTHPKNPKQTFRLGRTRPVARCPRFSLRNYLTREIAPPPATCSYAKPAAKALANIYMNDTLGDCVIAGIGHVVGVLTGNAGAPYIYTNEQIVQLYSAIGGYVPDDPATDKGCDEQTALNYWENKGAPAGTNQIAGWLSVNAADPTEFRTALYLFENLYFGLELPDAWINPMPSEPGFVWNVAGPSDPNNGHCVVGVGYTAEGVTIDSWGMTGLITNKAVEKYAVPDSAGELYTVVSQDGISKDFDSMGGHVTPPSSARPAR